MNAVIHLLKNENFIDNSENLFYNKSFYHTTFKNFIITDVKLLNKKIFLDFEQIFFKKNIDLKSIIDVLKMLEELNYDHVLIINSNEKQEKNNFLLNINELLNHFSVIDNIFEL